MFSYVDMTVKRHKDNDSKNKALQSYSSEVDETRWIIRKDDY